MTLTKHRIVESMPYCDAEDPKARRQRIVRTIIAWILMLIFQGLLVWAAIYFSPERNTQ